MPDYDVFISYRHDGGAQYARILQLMLDQRGYKVFLDYDEVRDGNFTEKIRKAIASSAVFMIILSENALDKCNDKEDWVRKEISTALKLKKKIIPVNPDKTFNGIHAELPKNIYDTFNTIHHSEIYFGQALGATVDSLIKQRIEPITGKRNSKQNVDTTFDEAKISLEKQERLHRFIKKLLVSVSIIITIGVGISIYFLVDYFNERRRHEDEIERLEKLQNGIIRKYAQFNPILSDSLPESKLLAIDTILSKMVTLYPDSIWISKTEFSKGEWADIMGLKCADNERHYPVSDKSFVEIMEVIKDSLSEMTSINFDLPSAEEWEYAANGGRYKLGLRFSGSNTADSVAWFRGNSKRAVHKCGRTGKLPNYLDLYDMSGNIGELCNSPYTDGNGTEFFTVCGGNYDSAEKDIEISSKDFLPINDKNNKVGFRLIIRKK
ncbi:MAG: TIR domain-containing protein [Muribaculaceae bacterium]|nr:TIR domain-containing protein [Muribaculaceae bacterium]